MKTTISVRCDGGVWATLSVVNDGNAPALVHNPRVARPTAGWQHSPEAFAVAVLRSFDILALDVRDSNGTAVASRDVVTLANHVAGVPIELKPGAAMELPVPLHELYHLTPGTDYSVAMTYGDEQAKVSAATSFRCP